MNMNHRVAAVSSIFTVIVLAASAPAQQPDPNSPRYKGVMALQRLIESTGDAPLKTFLDERVAPKLRSAHTDQELLRMIRQVRSDFADASGQGARPVHTFSARLMFESQGAGSRTELTFELESKPPHRFTDFGYKAPRKVDQGKARTGFPGELREYMDDLVSRDKFSGTVLVAKDGIPVFKNAYGLASKRFNVPNRIDTKLNLGSMNKMFTGVAICQLAEEGKLSFDDKIIKHLPDYPNRDVAETVTIHQLLTHTSGLGSYWNDKYEATWTSIRTLDQLLETFGDDPLEFTPGARFGYSNSGPVVLGLIIERITGQTYYDYVREHVYEPAGMTNTDCYAMDTPVPNLAIGYTSMDPNGKRVDGPRRNNLFSHSVKGGPSGGGFSTVEDLLKFSIALQDHTLLGPEMTETLLTGKVSMGPGMAYAYLFGDKIANGHRYVGHNGGAPGISADFRFYPKLGYTLAVLANYDGAAGGVGNFIRQIIERAPASESAESRQPAAQEMRSSGNPYRIGVMLNMGPDGIFIDSLLPGDVLVALNGISLADDPESVMSKAFSSPAIATFEILRDDKTLTIKLKPERVVSGE